MRAHRVAHMRLSTWGRWNESYLVLRILWVVSLLSTVALAVLCVLETAEVI